METNIYPAFAVPIVDVMHPLAARANRELTALSRAREAEGDRYRNPTPSLKQQAGVFESSLNLMSWQEPCIRDLEAFILSALGNTIAKLNRYTPEQLQKIEIFSHTWFHVTRHGGFTITHTHPMASWSGVYCVSPGETPERSEEHTSELQSLMRISYAVFCLKKKNTNNITITSYSKYNVQINSKY